MTAADRFAAAAATALVEAARAAGRDDRDAVLVWIAASEAAVRFAEDARAREAGVDVEAARRAAKAAAYVGAASATIYREVTP